MLTLAPFVVAPPVKARPAGTVTAGLKGGGIFTFAAGTDTMPTVAPSDVTAVDQFMKQESLPVLNWNSAKTPPDTH
jgi:hypothetical protein